MPKKDPKSTSFNIIAVARYLKTHYLCTCKNDTSRDGAVVARWAHNPKVGGSSPPPATKKNPEIFSGFFFHFPPLHCGAHQGADNSNEVEMMRGSVYVEMEVASVDNVAVRQCEGGVSVSVKGHLFHPGTFGIFPFGGDGEILAGGQMNRTLVEERQSYVIFS